MPPALLILVAAFKVFVEYTIVAYCNRIPHLAFRETQSKFSIRPNQVRFKNDFYGHSEPLPSQKQAGGTPEDTVAIDAVAEWRSLQNASPPIVLADNLTWLRNQGSAKDPRLLATVADRPGSRMRPNRARESGQKHGRTGDGGNADNMSNAGYDRSTPGDVVADFPVIPLEPFLWATRDKKDPKPAATQDLKSPQKHSNNWRDTGAEAVTARGSRLTHGVNTRMKQYSGANNPAWEEERGGEAGVAAARTSSEKCKIFHLVVDGVVFQVDASKPKGISRVWANVLPAVREPTAQSKSTTRRVERFKPQVQKFYSAVSDITFGIRTRALEISAK